MDPKECQDILTKDTNNIQECQDQVRECLHIWIDIECLILECQDILDLLDQEDQCQECLQTMKV